MNKDEADLKKPQEQQRKVDKQLEQKKKAVDEKAIDQKKQDNFLNELKSRLNLCAAKVSKKNQNNDSRDKQLNLKKEENGGSTEENSGRNRRKI